MQTCDRVVTRAYHKQIMAEAQRAENHNELDEDIAHQEVESEEASSQYVHVPQTIQHDRFDQTCVKQSSSVGQGHPAPVSHAFMEQGDMANRRHENMFHERQYPFGYRDTIISHPDRDEQRCQGARSINRVPTFSSRSEEMYDRHMARNIDNGPEAYGTSGYRNATFGIETNGIFRTGNVDRSINQIPGATYRRPNVMPESFDGTKSWTDYLLYFEACAQVNGWNVEEMGKYLVVCLRGHAQLVLSGLPPADRMNYRQLVKCLNNRFSPEHETDFFKVQLRGRTRKSRESLPELAQDITRLVYKAYPRAPREVHDNLTLDYFVEAITDSELRWRVIQSNPKTLNDAVSVASRMEAFQMAEKQRTQQRRNVHMVTKSNVSESNLRNLSSKLDEISKELQLLKTSENKDQKTNKTAVRSGSNKNKFQCFSCGSYDHLARDCPQRAKQGSSERKCHCCGSTDHLIRDCPEFKDHKNHKLSSN